MTEHKHLCADWCVLCLKAQVETQSARIAVLENSLVEIERRLRVDAAPLVELVNAHGGPEEKRAWKAVYACAIRAQVDGPAKEEKP